MPRVRGVSKRESTNLSFTGGLGGRRRTNDNDAEWIFRSDCSHNIVTPAPTNSNAQESDDDVSSEDSKPAGGRYKNVEGNRLIYLPLLMSGIHDIASCKKCADEIFERRMEQFFIYCDTQKRKVEHETRHMAISTQKKMVEEAFNVRSLFHQWWGQYQKQTSSNSLTIREVTYGLATTVQLCCQRCSLLPEIVNDRRGWKPHQIEVEPRKAATNTRTKSELCH
jgi:hypothetical protein